MDHRHLAFGLALESDFELPGMLPGEDPGLPGLRLRRAAPGQPLASAGSAARRAIWRGRLGDGEEFAIGRGVRSDLLFRAGDQDEYRLSPGRDLLECATIRPDVPRWLRTLLSRVLPDISLTLGNEGLHAAAVDGPTGVIAVAAPSGTGKSTLVARLLARGLPTFTDDVLVLSPAAGAVIAHAGTPHVTLPLDRDGRTPLGVPIDVRGGEAWTALDSSCATPRRIAALFLYRRGQGQTLGVERLPASPLHLAPYMLGIPGEGTEEAERFSLYSDLVESTPVFALRAELDRDPEEIADLVERTVVAEPAPSVGRTT